MVAMAELKSALREVLESRGVMCDVQAKLRAEVFHALEDQSVKAPTLCPENLLLNELIRDYLMYNNYQYSSSVLVAEAGHPTEPLDKAVVAKELNIPLEENDSIPLLYRMLSYFTQQKQTSTPTVVHKASVPSSSQPSIHENQSDKCLVAEPMFPSHS